MIYYELLEDSSIGRSTNNINIAKNNEYYVANQVVNKEEDIVYGYDNKRYLKGAEPQKPPELIQTELNIQQLAELENWFNNYFEKQLIQSTWQNDFKISPDPYFTDDMGNSLVYTNIEELKEKGEEVRKKIKELR